MEPQKCPMCTNLLDSDDHNCLKSVVQRLNRVESKLLEFVNLKQVKQINDSIDNIKKQLRDVILSKSDQAVSNNILDQLSNLKQDIFDYKTALGEVRSQQRYLSNVFKVDSAFNKAIVTREQMIDEQVKTPKKVHFATDTKQQELSNTTKEVKDTHSDTIIEASTSKTIQNLVSTSSDEPTSLVKHDNSGYIVISNNVKTQSHDPKDYLDVTIDYEGRTLKLKPPKAATGAQLYREVRKLLKIDKPLQLVYFTHTSIDEDTRTLWSYGLRQIPNRVAGISSFIQSGYQAKIIYHSTGDNVNGLYVPLNNEQRKLRETRRFNSTREDM